MRSGKTKLREGTFLDRGNALSSTVRFTFGACENDLAPSSYIPSYMCITNALPRCDICPIYIDNTREHPLSFSMCILHRIDRHSCAAPVANAQTDSTPMYRVSYALVRGTSSRNSYMTTPKAHKRPSIRGWSELRLFRRENMNIDVHMIRKIIPLSAFCCSFHVQQT